MVLFSLIGKVINSSITQQMFFQNQSDMKKNIVMKLMLSFWQNYDVKVLPGHQIKANLEQVPKGARGLSLFF